MNKLSKNQLEALLLLAAPGFLAYEYRDLKGTKIVIKNDIGQQIKTLKFPTWNAISHLTEAVGEKYPAQRYRLTDEGRAALESWQKNKGGTKCNN